MKSRIISSRVQKGISISDVSIALSIPIDACIQYVITNSTALRAQDCHLCATLYAEMKLNGCLCAPGLR